MEHEMNTRMILAAIAAMAAVTAAAGDDTPASPTLKPAATCRLTTGGIRMNFGTPDGLSVSGGDPASAIDYRCTGPAPNNVRGGSPIPVALFWTLASPGVSAGTGATAITTRGNGGILGIAGIGARIDATGGIVSVVVAP